MWTILSFSSLQVLGENGMKSFLHIEQCSREFAELDIRAPCDADMSKDLESSAFSRRSRSDVVRGWPLTVDIASPDGIANWTTNRKYLFWAEFLLHVGKDNAKNLRFMTVQF
jgi:hypothetical protein